MTSLSIGFGTAVAGVLLNLGAGGAEHHVAVGNGARTVFFGFAVICAAGVLTARRSDQRAA